MKVPVDALIDPAYSARRAKEIDPANPSETASVTPGLEKPQTTHFSIVDHWGNAISNTYTLNGWFGSGVVVEGAGFLLNDEMDDFSAKPGAPNQFGVVGGDANAIAPHKRPLSSMTPTILLKDGKVAMVIGTPGGSRIFTSVFQVLTDVYDFNLSLKDAQKQLRFHHQLLPENTIFTEPFAPLPPKEIAALKRARLHRRAAGLQRRHRGHPRHQRPTRTPPRPPRPRRRHDHALASTRPANSFRERSTALACLLIRGARAEAC